MEPEMSPFEAAVAVLTEILPDDVEFRARDAYWWGKTGGEHNRPTLDLYVEARGTSDLIRPLTMHFEIFIDGGLLVTQRLSEMKGIISRHEVPLSDPACFDKVHDYFARACVL